MLYVELWLTFSVSWGITEDTLTRCAASDFPPPPKSLTQHGLDETICMWNINTAVSDAQWACGVHIPLGGVQGGKVCLWLPVLRVWGVISSFTFQVQLCGRLVIHADVTRKGSLSPPPSLPLSSSLSPHVFAALIPRRVLQWARSVGSPCLIVCYFFNTYIMYFIRICCQSLSVPLHPITTWSLFFF